MEKHRVRRSDFFHSEVKVCPQETMREVIASHRTFYTLRGNSQTYTINIFPVRRIKGIVHLK